MIPLAKSNEMICFQLRNSLYGTLDDKLKADVVKISQKIEKRLLLANQGKAAIISRDILSALFKLRLKAFQWLTHKADFDYLQAIEQVLPQVEVWKQNQQMQELTENILFALRCNQRVAQSLAESGAFTEQTVNQAQ